LREVATLQFTESINAEVELSGDGDEILVFRGNRPSLRNYSIHTAFDTLNGEGGMKKEEDETVSHHASSSAKPPFVVIVMTTITLILLWHP
jgi:hypothetical protein